MIFDFRLLEWTTLFVLFLNLKYRNFNSHLHLLILISGDISLNIGTTHQHKRQCLKKWNININSLLPKLEKLRIIAKSTNVTVTSISESKLDEPVLETEIQTDDSEILRCDRNRHRWDLACYIRNDLSYYIITVFPREIESFFFEILLTNSKAITVGTIYRPHNESKFLKVLWMKTWIKLIQSVTKFTFLTTLTFVFKWLLYFLKKKNYK